MRRLAWTISGALLAAMLVVAAPLFADVVTMKHGTPGSSESVCPSGVCINDITCSSAVYTGWISVDGYAKATFGVKLTDANDTVTAVDVDCETSNTPGTTADAGYDVCAQVALDATGKSDIQCPHVWEVLNADADHFRITVDNLNDRFLQCKFTCTGTPAAADKIYAEILMRSP